MKFILIIYPFIIVLFVTYVYPKSHKKLTNPKYFYSFLSFNLLLFFLYLNIENSKWLKTNEGIISIFYMASPIFFQFLYKVFNKICQNKYKRDIYFRTRFDNDYESMHSTTFEFFLQLVLMSSVVLSMIIGGIIVKLFIS